MKALVVLAKPGDERIGFALLQCVEDETGEIKSAAAEALVDFVQDVSKQRARAKPAKRRRPGQEEEEEEEEVTFSDLVRAAMLICLENRRAAVRRAAVAVLAKVTPRDDAAAVAAITARLKDRDERVREAAASALA